MSARPTLPPTPESRRCFAAPPPDWGAASLPTATRGPHQGSRRKHARCCPARKPSSETRRPSTFPVIVGVSLIGRRDAAP
ncbi:hypothetical protein C8Q73DRAFT_694172 [Cubamyces lactineus]|nr:hypothetical protein C8Q73DRAFT_694172 [Cubamyces lactineus]